MQNYDYESGNSGFMFGLLTGAALGAALGLMLAPKSGSEMRQQLADSAGTLRRRASQQYDRATESVGGMGSRGSGTGSSLHGSRESSFGETSETRREWGTGSSSGTGSSTGSGTGTGSGSGTVGV